MGENTTKPAIYKKLRSSDLGAVVLFSVLMIILAALVMFFVIGCIELFQTDVVGGAVTSLVLAALTVLYLYATIKSLKKSRKRNAQRNKLINKLSYFELESLQEQINNSEPYFKTFYLLDEYLYVPSAKLLIGYGDIKEFKTIIHSTNGLNDAVKIKITDPDNAVFEFYVKKWKLYLEKYTAFMTLLDEKRK